MKIGVSYKITIEINEKILTYTGRIISEDDSFITFEDKFGTTFSYNKNNIISAEELK